MPAKNLLATQLAQLQKLSMLIPDSSLLQKYEVIEGGATPWRVSLTLPFLPSGRTFYSELKAKRKDAEEDCANQAVDFIKSLMDQSYTPNIRPAPDLTISSSQQQTTPKKQKVTVQNSDVDEKEEVQSEPPKKETKVDNGEWFVTKPEWGAENMEETTFDFG